jgi:hypothetical protein
MLPGRCIRSRRTAAHLDRRRAQERDESVDEDPEGHAVPATGPKLQPGYPMRHGIRTANAVSGCVPRTDCAVQVSTVPLPLPNPGAGCRRRRSTCRSLRRGSHQARKPALRGGAAMHNAAHARSEVQGGARPALAHRCCRPSGSTLWGMPLHTFIGMAPSHAFRRRVTKRPHEPLRPSFSRAVGNGPGAAVTPVEPTARA